MEAKELMIGDWVYGSILKAHTKVCKIDSLKIKAEGYELYQGERYFEPIPLTAEILEKNGFIRQQFGHFRYENEDEDLAMGFYPKEKNYTEGGYDYIDIYKGRMTLREMPISYVHELQHALKLCGIDKEIVL